MPTHGVAGGGSGGGGGAIARSPRIAGERPWIGGESQLAIAGRTLPGGNRPRGRTIGVGVFVGGTPVGVRLGVFVGVTGVAVRVAVFVGGIGVAVRVAVFVGGIGVAVRV